MAKYRDDRLSQDFHDYRLIAFLGRGSFGAVYLGEHREDKSLAAVKILDLRPTDIDEMRQFMERFINEELRAARFNHPNIVRILDFGMKHGNPFLIMEYASNGTLRERHPGNTPLPLTTVVAYIKQLALALQYVHDRKKVHRDVKPENILVGADGEILLSDFGIATIAHSPATAKTQESIGTVPYMAPEQLDGKPCAASDQYALGIIAYEWLCGERPFNGTRLEMAIFHRLQPPPSLCEKVPDLPSEVEQVVMKSLAKNPEERFASVQAFANALEEASQPKPSPGTTLFTYTRHKDEVWTVAWSPDELHIASGSADTTVQVWLPFWKNAQIERVETTITYKGHSKVVDAVAWSPGGRRIASASLDKTVHVWDVATSNCILSYAGHANRIRTLAWSPNGRYIALGAWDGTVQIWDTETEKMLSTYRGHIDEVRALAWSPDPGSYIVSASADKTVRLWNVNTHETLITYSGHTKNVNAVAWSPDGHRIATGSLDSTVQVWDATTGEKLLIYSGHSAGVSTLAWSPDGKRIASGGRDHLVHIWDAATGKHISTYSAHSGWIMALSWSRNSKYIASGSVDTTVHIWRAQ